MHSRSRSSLPPKGSLHQSQTGLFMSTVALPEQETAASAEDMAKTTASDKAFTNQVAGEVVAEGSIMSVFKGGFAAVQLNDEIIADTNSEGQSFSVDTPPAMGGENNNKRSKRTSNKKNGQKGEDLVGRLAKLPDGSLAVVMALRPPMAFVYSESDIQVDGDGVVEVYESMAKIAIPSAIKEGGGLMTCFGKLEEAESPIELSGLERAMFAPIPQVKDIALINSPMLTGTTMVDALAPIGKGQNMLLIGSDLSEMRGLACDFLTTQVKNPTTKCIYAATQDRSEVLNKLKEAGIADDVVVVATRAKEDGGASDTVSEEVEATSVAATACAIGEAFAVEEGKDALVIVDTIDAHKDLWDATTRVLVDVYGSDAVVKADREGAASSEMRAFYSSLIQRAAQFNANNGGGSVTLALLTTIPGDDDVDGKEGGEDTVFAPEDFADCGDKIKTRIDMLVSKNIPLSTTNLRKIQIPIPSASEGKKRMALQHVDDLISMSDGQIWLDDELQKAGQRPPMDPQRSITRVGIGADTQSRADAPAIRRVVEGVRLDLAQAANMDGAEDTNASTKQIRQRKAWLLAVHQEEGHGGRTLAESCAVLLAAQNGLLNDSIDAGHLAGTKEGQEVVDKLLQHMKDTVPTAMESINETLDATPEVKKELEDALDAFFATKS